MTDRPASSAAGGSARPGVVSVVLVAEPAAAHDVADCLRSFDRMDWPTARLELVVGWIGTGADADPLRSITPTVVVVEVDASNGPAAARHRAALRASGEYLGFLDAGLRPDPQWIRPAVDVLDQEPGVASVASAVLDPSGGRVDGVGRPISWFGLPCEPVGGQPGRWGGADEGQAGDVLFATAAAMFVRAAAYRDAGGFDEHFVHGLDDLDLGWRLNLLGHRVRFEPRSSARLGERRRERGAARWPDQPAQLLLERNALASLYKNYDDSSLARALPAALTLAVRRGFESGRPAPGAPTPIPAPVLAVDAFLDLLPALVADRRRIQAARRRSDAQVLPLFRDPLPGPSQPGRYRDGHDAAVAAFGLADHFGTRRRVLVVTSDTLSDRMAGPAIRAWEMARALSGEHEVELATLSSCSITHPRFRCRAVSNRDLQSLVPCCDVLIFQGFLLTDHPWIKDTATVLVVDIYDPFHLEALEQAKDLGEPRRQATVRDCTATLNEQLRRGDFFLCASGKQRDFWLGQLAALGRINPLTYDEDETLESLIAVAPFGLSPTPPVHDRPAIKGVVEGIGPDDSVILWGGGIWNWFDPLTLLRAVDRLRHRRPDVRLFFLGLRSPNPLVPEMRMAVAARQLSDSLGLTGRFAFFNEGWVPYDDRQNYLLEADIGVSTHLDHVETEFSFRTRILDYLWAGLPIVATSGDTFGDLITQAGLGVAVPPGDVAALEDALFRLLDDREFAAACRARVAAAASGFSWSSALAPLLEFCREPRRAPDLIGALGPAPPATPPGAIGGGAPTWRSDVELFRQYLRKGGMREVGRRAYGRVRRRARELTGLPGVTTP